MSSTHVEQASQTDAGVSAILQAAGSGTWEWRAATGQVSLSREWLATLGYEPGDLSPAPDALFALIHPDDQPRARRRLLAHRGTEGDECECVGRLRRKDGAYQWRRERGVVLERDGDGRPQRVVGLGTNIADPGEAGEHTRPWEHVFDQTQFGLVITSGADDRILAVNEAYARMHGCSVDDLIGQPLARTCDVPPADPAAPGDGPDGHVVGEFLHRRLDGTTFPALHESTVVRNTRDMPVSRIGFVIDVSAREDAVAALRRSEERFRLVAVATRDVLWDWNVVTGHHWWSPNAVALFRHDPNTDQDIADWTTRLHPDDRPRVEASLHGALTGTAESWESDYRFLLADGTYGEFLDRGHIMRDGDGRAVRMIGAMTDVTAVSRAHRSLVDAHQRLQATSRDVHLAESRERAALARELHDEFGQLLTAAKLSASSLRSLSLDGLSAARQQQVADKVASLCDVLDMALHGVRNVATQLRPPALDQLGLARALEGLAAQVERHTGLPCVVDIDQATRARVVGPVEGAAIYRIVQELLTNAARHAAATLVQVRLTTTDGAVRIAVEDDGRGFAADADRPGGTLGLKGLRERAELLGGTASIDSRPGRGTTVRVVIPLGDPA